MTVRLENPALPGTIIEVPDSAVGHHAMSGWVPAKGEPIPTCPTCGSVWPAYTAPPPDEQQSVPEAPAEESGASSSKASRRRRTSSEESE